MLSRLAPIHMQLMATRLLRLAAPGSQRGAYDGPVQPFGAVLEHEVAQPEPRLSPLVRRSVGYRYSGLAPGTHLGLPSPSLTLVISLGPRTRLARMPNPVQQPAAFDVLVGGLHSRPAVIAHEGELFGIQLDLTPEGARSLLGLPAGELASCVVGLDEVVGRGGAERLEAVGEARTWPERFAMVDGVLAERLDRQRPLRPVRPELDQAWRQIVSAGGAPRVSEVARAVGWSRRHLLEGFLAEYGVTPKQLGRIARFHRSKQILQRTPAANLAQVAATCGYCDQSHLARDWNDLAGCAPSRWLGSEELSFSKTLGGTWRFPRVPPPQVHTQGNLSGAGRGTCPEPAGEPDGSPEYPLPKSTLRGTCPEPAGEPDGSPEYPLPKSTLRGTYPEAALERTCARSKKA